MNVTSAGRLPRFVYLSDSAGSVTSARYGWRLVAANYRPLGRGRLAHSSLEACQVAARDIHSVVESADVAFIPVHGTWTWQVAVEGIVMAVCVHPYVRRVECARGLAHFVDAARAAQPGAGVVRHFGANALRGYVVDETVTGALA